VSSSKIDQGRHDRLPWIALTIIALVAIVVVIAYFGAEKAEEQRRAQQQEERAERRAVEEGTACDAIFAARRAFDDGAIDELRESIKAAERQAIIALNTSGIGFGRAEEMALYLGAEELRSERAQDRIDRRLDKAQESCVRLDT
jgi:hypothetical protein